VTTEKTVLKKLRSITEMHPQLIHNEHYIQAKPQRNAEDDEAKDAERNTVSILRSIANLERGFAPGGNGPGVTEQYTTLGEIHQDGSRPVNPRPCDLIRPSQESERGQFSLKEVQSPARSCQFGVAAKHGARKQVPGQRPPQEIGEESRTLADVFADRAPSTINMELLWKMQANHYKEFASRLYDGDAGPIKPEESPDAQPLDAKEAFARTPEVQNHSEGGRSSGSDVASSQKGIEAQEGEDLSVSGQERERNTRREGPSRKSLRRAKRRMLEQGSLGREPVPLVCSGSGRKRAASIEPLQSLDVPEQVRYAPPEFVNYSGDPEGSGDLHAEPAKGVRPPELEPAAQTVVSVPNEVPASEVAAKRPTTEQEGGRGRGGCAECYQGQPSNVSLLCSFQLPYWFSRMAFLVCTTSSSKCGCVRVDSVPRNINCAFDDWICHLFSISSRKICSSF
jgi:hypothetical protein